MKKFNPLPFALALLGCGTHSFDEISECATIKCLIDRGTSALSITGYLRDDLSTIPKDIMISNFSEGSLPSKVSLEDKFPPIQNQGNYGTCVAWSTAYNLKTALNAIEKGWTSAELARPGNQTSPKDIWFAIDDSDKGSSSVGRHCSGTTFKAALDALISKGAASAGSVPYNMASGCSGTSIGDANNKLANYRQIAYNYALWDNTYRTESEGMSLGNFKGHLAQGRPVLFSATVCDRFMRWNNNSIMNSDTHNNCGGHAMVLVGYDDSKEAFRVRNSWGIDWADNGSIWVDYNFFITNFAEVAFIAQNPPTATGGNNHATGYDLLALYAEDYSDPENAKRLRNRAFYYEVYNNGSLPVLASQKWSVFYMYYNAYDANDFQIIFEDYYTNEYGSPGQYGEYEQTDAYAGGFWNNMNVLPGKKTGEAEFGEKGFYIPYEMPSITGDYYLVVYADVHNAIEESNESNNLYFITSENGKPLKFTSGVLQSVIATPAVAGKVLAKKAGRAEPAASVAELGELNGYTPAEIKALVKQSKQNGVLAKKAAEYRKANGGAKKLKKIKRL
jgi:hypothetical protein